MKAGCRHIGPTSSVAPCGLQVWRDSAQTGELRGARRSGSRPRDAYGQSGHETQTPPETGTQNGAGDHSPAPSVKSARRSGAHGALVVLHQVDAALVALVAAEGGLQERVDEGESLFLSVLTGTDGHDVRVVVLAG